jgi:hypothetical protein
MCILTHRTPPQAYSYPGSGSRGRDIELTFKVEFPSPGVVAGTSMVVVQRGITVKVLSNQGTKSEKSLCRQVIEAVAKAPVTA